MSVWPFWGRRPQIVRTRDPVLSRAQGVPSERRPVEGLQWVGRAPRPFARLSAPCPAPLTAAVSAGLCRKPGRPICGFHIGWEQPQASQSDCPPRPGRTSSSSRDRRRRPEANHTIARSCDCMAVSADWPQLGVSASLLLPSAPTSAPELQANEMALYRRPLFAFFFSPPWRGRRSSDWPNVLGSPLSFTNQRERYTPSGVFQPIARRPRRPALQFHPRLQVSRSLTLNAFS